MPRPEGGYYLKDGTRVPGVTTITGRFKDSGGLLWWSFEQGKAAERGEINSLYDKRDLAADAGTLAHEMVYCHIREEPLPTTQHPETIQEQAQQGFDNYMTWAKNNRIKVDIQEIDMVSEEYAFGGCPDALGTDSEGQSCLIDWKCSNGIYPDYLIQLAAYNQLFKEYGIEITGGFHLCRFSKEHADFAHHYWSELDDAWEQFKLFRRAYDIDKILRKRV